MRVVPSVASGRYSPGPGTVKLLEDGIHQEIRPAMVNRSPGWPVFLAIDSKLLEVSATVQINQDEVIVSLDKRAHNPYLVASRLTDQPVPMPWLGHQRLLIW